MAGVHIIRWDITKYFTVLRQHLRLICSDFDFSILVKHTMVIFTANNEQFSSYGQSIFQKVCTFYYFHAQIRQNDIFRQNMLSHHRRILVSNANI